MKVRLLSIVFDLNLPHEQIPKFRGAVIKATGNKNNLFHNHTQSGNIYRYPKIQYKTIGQKAAIISIEEGIEALQDFFEHPKQTLQIRNEEKEIKVDSIFVKNLEVRLWNSTFHYRIYNWLALNQENYRRYHACHSLSEKIELLEKILISNILSLLQGIDLFIDEHIDIKITHLLHERICHYKGQKMQAFNLHFSSNLSLPDYIGLGKGSSIGFGVIKEVNKEYKKN